jgi:hypothetical protein
MAKNEKKNFELRKGTEHDFDFSKGSKRKFDLTKDEEEAVASPLQNQSVEPIDAQTIQTPKSVNGGDKAEKSGSSRLIIGLLVIVLVGLLVWWLLPSSDESEQVTSESPTETAVSSDEATTDEPESTTNPANTAVEKKAVASHDEAPIKESTPVEKPNQEKTYPQSTVSDDIETEAKNVIRGKYGNNPDRRNVLGSRYDEIQSRVNQLMNK